MQLDTSYLAHYLCEIDNCAQPAIAYHPNEDDRVRCGDEELAADYPEPTVHCCDLHKADRQPILRYKDGSLP